MNNAIRVAMALAVTGLFGCTAAPADGVDAEDLGQAAEALSGYSGSTLYYSDSTYTTIVGGRSSNCSGATSSWGTKTKFAQGEYDSCGSGVTYGCYQLECEPPFACWNTCDYDACINC